MPFLTQLKVEAVNEGEDDWRLTEPLVYASYPNLRIKIPVGFPCDLASIPRLFQLFIQVNERHREAATLHDWLYYKKGIIENYTFNRAECDKIFLRAMEESDVPTWKRYAMYWAVRIGGYIAWSN